jgi:4'-phosphopantetheinyl transferase
LRLADCNLLWRIPPENIQLDRNEVHVWHVLNKLPDRCLSQLAQTLSDDEGFKAKHFHFEQDRRHFVIRRGVLRSILGQYLCIEPSCLHFRYGPFGKPYLIEQPVGDVIQFSLAHSHELNIYAFCRNQEIGVDLEYVRPPPDSEQIAVRFFSVQENADYLGLPTEQRQEAFYVCWTGKEAYVKALGSGFVQPSGQLALSLIRRKTAQFSWVPRDLAEPIHVSLETLVPAPGYIGTLAIAGSEYSMSCYQWIPG